MNSAAVRLSNNEKEFIKEALRSELRIDGRRPFDVRQLYITFSKQDGAVEVQQGETKVMAVVTGQLGPPYPDRPTEGTLAIFTEFSPMADPSFEPGRPGEMAVELGRIIDRGLRESRAVDTESLCVLAGQAVWAIRVDIHILDNGGNLVDVANVAALAALLSFRRPDCTLGGHNGQDVIVHPPEVREPVSLIVHHLPIAVTFGFFGDGDLQVVDPSLKEEAVMGSRLTVTLNEQGDICAMQKGGGVGIRATEVMRCVRIAFTKASEVTGQLKRAVEANTLERSKEKIKRHPTSTFLDVTRKQPLPSVVDVDAVMLDAVDTSGIPEEKRNAMMDIIREEEAEASSSEDEDEEDIVNRIEEKKRKLEGETAVRNTSKTNGELESTTQISRKAGLFEGGLSLRESESKHIKSKRKASERNFDTSALAEFDELADSITTSVTQSSSSGVSARAPLDPETMSKMSAAVVYAQMPGRGAAGGRPLGPIFPIGQKGTLVENEQPSTGSLPSNVVQQEPSLLDAVKAKRKKGKKH